MVIRLDLHPKSQQLRPSFRFTTLMSTGRMSSALGAKSLANPATLLTHRYLQIPSLPYMEHKWIKPNLTLLLLLCLLDVVNSSSIHTILLCIISLYVCLFSSTFPFCWYSWWLEVWVQPIPSILTVTIKEWATGIPADIHPKCNPNSFRECRATLLTANLDTNQGTLILLSIVDRQLNNEFWYYVDHSMSMQLPGAWQGVPAQAGGGAPMSGQQMAAAAAVTQQGGMVASYPIQQFQVRFFTWFIINNLGFCVVLFLRVFLFCFFKLYTSSYSRSFLLVTDQLYTLNW